jgi:integrase
MLLAVFKRTWAYGLGIKVREVKLFMLRSWLAERRKEQNLKAAGVNNYLRMLHGLFALAVDLGAISENTARAIRLMREESPERLTPTWQQAQSLIESVKRPESKMALSAMLLLGLGQAELRNLRGEHFDLERGCVVVRRQKTQKIFTVPIFPQARPLVKMMCDEGRLEHERQVFLVYNPREAITLACRRLGLPSFSPRSFRRAFIIRALEKGIDPRVVAAWQGHRDATLILRVYGHWINQDHARRMAALMN